MRKKFLLLAVLAAALMLLAGTALAETAVPEHAHWAYCDNPKVCAVCGEAYAGDDVRHEYDWQNLQYDATGHWDVCDRCGAEIGRTNHYANCPNPEVCAECGAPYKGYHIIHQDGGEIQHNAQYHWHVCELCGEITGLYNHRATCDNPNVCADCGIPYSGDNIEHAGNVWQSDDTYHWYMCPLCGETAGMEKHKANCDNPTVCAYCGAACTGVELIHWASNLWQTDDTYHWEACAKCGEIVDIVEHWAYCNAPDVCGECGVPYSGDRVWHQAANILQSDETHHWEVCPRCKEITYSDEHWAYCDALGVCGQCGAAYTGSNINHMIDNDVWESDATSHWHLCPNCGATVGKAQHWADCDAPGVCRSCGAVYTGPNISHSYDWYTWESDANSHWHVCTACQAVLDQAEHYALCNAPGVCVTCGATYTGSNVQHVYDRETWQSDDTAHWHVCTECGAISDRSEHWAYCDKPNVCASCGADYAGSDIRHSYNWENWQTDGTNHWHVCTKSGEILHLAEHWAYCNDPNVCAECGADYDGSNIQHTLGGSLHFDDTNHWFQCIYCDAVISNSVSSHWALCGSPTVCAQCGADYAGSDIRHTYDWETWQSDDTAHWHVCTECGAICDRSEHWALCDNPNVCANCGADYVGSNISHTYNRDDWYSDETSHWRVCTKCGAEVNKREHWADCSNPTVCGECGAAYAGNDIRHLFDWQNWQSDETGHWHVCTVCGEKTDKDEHYAHCDNPTVCWQCGAAYAGDEIYHNFDWSNLQHNDNSHWAVCTDCGETDVRIPHRASCIAPGTCEECGVVYTGDRVNHEYDWVYYSDETSHWMICTRCGEVIEKNKHWAYCDTPNVCAECGAVYAGDNIEHHYDWDNMSYDDDCHWAVCTVCGALGEKSVHYVDCTDLTHCAGCGASCSGIEPWHNYNDTDIVSEGKYHWWICEDCGEAVFKSRHYAACTDPNHCAVCGADYDGSDIEHNYDWEDVQSDANTHWHVCLDCGKIVDKSSHYASCINPTVCAGCGQPYSGSNLSHNVNWNKQLHDETYHWYICLDCGETVNQYEHWAYCDTPNVCAECGVAYSGSNVQHDWYWDDAQTDETSHWWICERCGEVDNKGTHYALCDRPGICAVCERPYTGSDIRHYADEDSVYSSDATNHWTACPLCGETWIMPHEFDKDGVCYVCGYKETHEHTWQVTAETAATCTADGSRTSVCSVCGETKTETLASPGHTWTLTASKAATCTEDGSETYTCSVCGETKTETLANLGGHNWQVTASTPATCTEDGSETYACSVCGETKTETLTSPGHAWVLTASTPATCTEDGSETYACSVCGETKTETLPNLGGHDWQLTASKAVTCTEDGSETYTCSVCGETRTETLPNPGGHNWQLTASTPATCTEDGCEAYTCSVCGETKMEALSDLGHDWKQDETRPATCTEGASVLMTCTRCGIWTLEYTSEPLEHELKPVETKDATCTAPGSIVSRCDNCGETATEIIPALGHAYGDYAPSGDDSHVATCSRCGMKLSKACQMKETKLGALTYSICSVCGRTAVQTPAAPTETAAPAKTASPAESAAPAENASAAATATPAPTPTSAPVEVKVIQNAVIEAVPAKNTAEAKTETVVPKEAVLVVLDCSAIVAAPTKTKAAEASEPAAAKPADSTESTESAEAVAPVEEAVPVLSAFSVSLVVEGEEVELTSAVKVRIPLTEETAPSDLTGLKLVLILPSGEMVDVEFEIVDGELIFTTDMLGMFAFVPVEE